ncbi:MAG TPA: GNAT family N-acetyltransferase [Chitinophagaceae bacterium]|nr:GNAT family N-acetyltransferase [Chitinophagaceae bacterium]
MALKMIDHGSKEYQQMINLRYNILRKPLGLSFTPDELEKEKNNVLIGVFEDDQLLGCCMLVKEDNKKMRLRQVAVPNNQQGKGIGRALMSFAENISRDLGYNRIMMHARKTAIPFFEKLGYKVTSEVFDEITIPHLIMEKEL